MKISVESQEASETVSPGELLVVNQVIGSCKDGTIYTEEYFTRSTSNSYTFSFKLLLVSWTLLIGKMLCMFGQI